MRLVATAAALACLATGAAAQEVTLRMEHFVSNDSAIAENFILPWAKAVEEQSGGRIAVEVYPNMQLGGSPATLYDQIADGAIDGGWAIPGYSPGRFPATEVFELPFIGSTSAAATSQALWRFYEEYLTDSFSAIKVLAMHVHGPGVIHTKDVAVRGIADMEGLKMRTPTRVAGRFLTELGATPVGMPLPEFPQALSRGVVDGGALPWGRVPDLRLDELAPHHTVLGGDRALYNTVFIWAMNRDEYERLPDDLKGVIDANSGVSASEWAGSAMDEADETGRAAAEASGNEIIRIPADALGPWKAAGREVVESWISEMAAEGMPAERMVSDARDWVAEFAGK